MEDGDPMEGEGDTTDTGGVGGGTAEGSPVGLPPAAPAVAMRLARYLGGGNSNSVIYQMCSKPNLSFQEVLEALP